VNHNAIKPTNDTRHRHAIDRIDHQPTTGPARSRRGFLKQAAATSILGLSGLTVATEAASATATTKPTESPRRSEYTEATEATGITELVTDVRPMDYRGFDKIVEILERGPFYVDYYIDSKGDIIPAYGTEGDDSVGNDVAHGTVYNGYTDAYYVQYGVNFIGDSDGDVDYAIFEV
jgi:hypothetical protein